MSKGADPRQSHLPDSTTLDLYKLAVEMADRVSARRAGANTFFVSLHGSLAAVVGVIGAVVTSKDKHPDPLTFGVLAVVGMILSVTWWLLLRYYRRLNSAKFEVIVAIEESQLPLQIYADEWKTLHPAEEPPENPSSWDALGPSSRSGVTARPLWSSKLCRSFSLSYT